LNYKINKKEYDLRFDLQKKSIEKQQAEVSALREQIEKERDATVQLRNKLEKEKQELTKQRDELLAENKITGSSKTLEKTETKKPLESEQLKEKINQLKAEHQSLKSQLSDIKSGVETTLKEIPSNINLIEKKIVEAIQKKQEVVSKPTTTTEEEKRPESLRLELFQVNPVELEETRKQMTILREKYFTSIVVSLKLQLHAMGKDCNVDATSLYSMAPQNFISWPEWVMQQVHEQSTPKPYLTKIPVSHYTATPPTNRFSGIFGGLQNKRRSQTEELTFESLS